MLEKRGELTSVLAGPIDKACPTVLSCNHRELPLWVMGNKKAQVAAAVRRFVLPLASGLAFLIGIYIRFYSGLIAVHDRPVWPAYIAYFVLFVSMWSVIDARFDVAELCLWAPSMRTWAWSLVQMDLLTLALSSCAAFFWRAYSFSRLAIAVFWCVHILLCMLAYYVQWHMQEAWRELLFSDEDQQANRHLR